MAVYFLDKEAEDIFVNGDKLLHKVMPVDRVIEMLDKHRWAFVSPTLWSDPFERAFLEAEYNHGGKSFFLPIRPVPQDKGFSYILFSMCWTLTPESEAFWKTYAPNSDGLRISVRPSEFLSRLRALRDYDVYIGKAIYQDFKKLYDFKNNESLWRELQKSKVNEDH